MAGLTRKLIKDLAKDAGIEIPSEMVDAIIGAHVESRDAAVEKAVEPLAAQIEADKITVQSDGYQEKYEALLKTHEALQTEIVTKETNAKKQAAVRALLAEVKIGEKRHDLILKALAPDLDKIELDKDGKIKDADTLKTTLSTDWAEFVETTEKVPNNTPPTPPQNQSSGVGALKAQYDEAMKAKNIPLAMSLMDQIKKTS